MNGACQRRRLTLHVQFAVAVIRLAQFDEKDVRAIAVVLDREVGNAENGPVLRRALIGDGRLQVRAIAVNGGDVQIGGGEVETRWPDENVFARQNCSRGNQIDVERVQNAFGDRRAGQQGLIGGRGDAVGVVVDLRRGFGFSTVHVLEMLDDERFLLEMLVGEIDRDGVRLEVDVDERLKIIFDRVEVLERETVVQRIDDGRWRRTGWFGDQLDRWNVRWREQGARFEKRQKDVTLVFLGETHRVVGGATSA